MTVYPLGYPVEFESSSAIALQAVERRWGSFPQLFQTEPLRFRIEAGAGEPARAAPEYGRGPETFWFRADDANVAHFSLVENAGRIKISASTLQDSEWFQIHFVEGMVLTALDSIFFDPVHAACVARDGKGILLCGDSGAGKTTLAFACTRAGWTLVSEDGIHLGGQGAGTLVGGFWRFRLREPARALFPEIENRRIETMPNGKFAIPVDADAEGLPVGWSARAGRVVLLRRGPGLPRLTEWNREEAHEFLMRHVMREDRHGAARRFHAMLEAGAVCLEYEQFTDALTLLAELEGYAGTGR